MKFSFKAYKANKEDESPGSSGSGSAARLKRKEQVRKAQRTYRERKEAYIRVLEAEVVQLRANEMRTLQEMKSLSVEVSALKSLLHENGIPVPPHPNKTPGLALSPPSSTMIQSSGQGEQMSLICCDRELKNNKRQRQICVQGFFPASASGHSQTNAYLVQDTSPQFLDRATSALALTTPHPTIRLGQLDQTSLGLDFILTLESPCLSHIDSPHDPSNHDPAGHALTVSACLLLHHPAQSGSRTQSSTPWQVPGADIERLLKLSHEISLGDDDITPVQAWDIVRRHEQFAEVEVERLQSLKEKLLTWVNCYGFGGVIPLSVLENAIFEAFIVGRVF